MSNREEYQYWLAEHKEDEAVEKYFDDRRTDNKATEFLKGVEHD